MIDLYIWISDNHYRHNFHIHHFHKNLHLNDLHHLRE